MLCASKLSDVEPSALRYKSVALPHIAAPATGARTCLAGIVEGKGVPAAEGGLHDAHAAQLGHITRLALSGAVPVPQRAARVPAPRQQLHQDAKSCSPTCSVAIALKMQRAAGLSRAVMAGQGRVSRLK